MMTTNSLMSLPDPSAFFLKEPHEAAECFREGRRLDDSDIYFALWPESSDEYKRWVVAQDSIEGRLDAYLESLRRTNTDSSANTKAWSRE